jgi:hypothetical protein
MTEARLLSLVARHPHPVALARRLGAARAFGALLRLEERGLVARRRGLYRLTRRGRDELWMARAIAQIVLRARSS